MKNRLFLSAFVALSLLFSLSQTHARKPAVEPVMGISIDNYKDVPPSQAKGFDWNSNKADAVSSPAQPVYIKKQIPTQNLKNVDSTDQTNTSNSPYILLGLLAALPFVLWFGIMKGLPDQETIIDNTIQFPSNKDKDDDDIDYRKAS